MADTFPESEVKVAWERASAKCECMNVLCGHVIMPHSRDLIWEHRGNDDSFTGWEAHHINQNEPSIARNCQILCIECHKRTDSYGKHISDDNV